MKNRHAWPQIRPQVTVSDTYLGPSRGRARRWNQSPALSCPSSGSMSCSPSCRPGSRRYWRPATGSMPCWRPSSPSAATWTWRSCSARSSRPRCRWSEARYGALGVIGDDGRLAEFIPVGLDEAQIAAIDHWPEGNGLLGTLITRPTPAPPGRPVRPPGVTRLPAGHPPMRSFLGVPIRIRDEVYGNLYLTEKEGGGQFDEEDETLLVALAAAAGVAIDNARLYEEARRQERWLRATSRDHPRAAVGAALHGGAGAGHQAGAGAVRRRPGGARGAAPVTEQRLVNTHAAGKAAGEALGLVLPATESLSGQVLASGQTVAVEDFRNDEPGGPRWPESTCRWDGRSCCRWARPGTCAACSPSAATPRLAAVPAAGGRDGHHVRGPGRDRAGAGRAPP